MTPVSGFTLVRNGVRFDYPFVESLRSLLPVVDQLVINVGIGDDDTINRVRAFARDEGQGKVDIFESEWPLQDPEKKKSGLILSEQTNLALDRCRYDWCLYLQADEVLHEQDYSTIRESIQKAEERYADGVVLEYRHFYGSFQVAQKTRSAYRREIRIVKKSSGARSVGDAQSFLKPCEDATLWQKLDVVLSVARIFHYGWVRPPEAMKTKTIFMDQLYHGSPDHAASNSDLLPHTGNNFQYKKFWGLQPFSRAYPGESHPKVMTQKIKAQDWNWDLDASPMVFKPGDVKKVLLDGFEKVTGYRPFEFKNYRILPG
jgi:hypothetical protein